MESSTRVPFSPVIVGTMKLGQWGAKFSTTQYQAFIEGCLAAGATTFDHADIYGHYTTEAEFGEVLRQQPRLREQMQIITKCGIQLVSEHRPAHRIKSYNNSKEHIIAAVEHSLKALNTDYIDVLLIHRPDYLMHTSEVAEAVQILNQQDKIIDFGVSNFSGPQFELMQSKASPCTNQVECSLLRPQALDNGILSQCQQHRIPLMAWSPLGGGSIFQPPLSEQEGRIRATALPLMEKYACSLDQLLLAWLFRLPTWVLPVIGTSQLKRVSQAMAAVGIQLEREDWYALLQASTGRPVA